MKKSIVLLLSIAFLGAGLGSRQASCCIPSQKTETKISACTQCSKDVRLSARAVKCECCKIQSSAPTAATVSPAVTHPHCVFAVLPDDSSKPSTRSELITRPHLHSPPGQTLVRTFCSRAPPSLA